MNSTKKLTFEDFISEFLAGFFAYDSKIRKSLNALIFHPGKATKEYIAGKRTQYANPFRFYLSISIIFFVLYSFFNVYQDSFLLNDNAPTDKQLSPQEIQELKEDLKKTPASPSPQEVDSIINSQLSSKTYKDFYFTQKQLDSMPWYNELKNQFDLYQHFTKETKIVQPTKGLDSLKHDNSTYNRWVYKKSYNLNTIQENPSIFIGYVVNKMPIIIFFFLPVFALVLWLVYIRRPYNYMEHLIFTFHVQSVFFVFLGIALFLDLLFGTDFISGFSLFVFLVYLYLALRSFYKQGWFKSLVKFLILNVLFLILAVVAAVISFAISFAIF
ncbi:MAG: DUF3667 domain-containing protein [Gillisia sp.]